MTDPITDDELARLEELAGKATAGPWRERPWGSVTSDDCPPHLPVARTSCREDAAYIAAANPSALRALIARLRRAEEALRQTNKVAGRLLNRDVAAKTAGELLRYSIVPTALKDQA